MSLNPKRYSIETSKKSQSDSGGLSGYFKGGGIQPSDANGKEMIRQWNEASAELNNFYSNVELPSKVGFARFVKNDIEFSVEGKFFVSENFNAMAGYHFAFEITSTELTEMSSDYDDVCDYENIGFNISIGYFDGVPLSEYENSHGVVVTEIFNIEGSVAELSIGDNCNLQVTTVETDEIEKGEIKFLKWNSKEKVISFKLAVPWGLNDIIVGAVSLDEDKLKN